MNSVGSLRAPNTLFRATHLPFRHTTRDCSNTHVQHFKRAARYIRAYAASTSQEQGEGKPAPLQQGVVKHTLSVYVADEAGMINRVAGVFARRGVNIESLAVGLTAEQALFTIVINDAPPQVVNICKQIAKLVKVRLVEDITKVRRIERELMLMKLRAPAGPARTEVLQLAEIFRARVVDVSERCLALAVAGDPGKMIAFQKVMRKFGIVEIVRTGKITLRRGVQPKTAAAAAMEQPHSHHHQHIAQHAPASASGEFEGSDDDDDVEAVWDVGKTLDAMYSPQRDAAEHAAHTLSIRVHDTPGVLNEITGLFARRGYNITSLAVGPSEKPGESCITMVVPGQSKDIDNLVKQIEKLPVTVAVTDLTEQPIISYELALIKVKCSPSQRSELHETTKIFRSTICDVATTSVTLQVQGKQEKMKALERVLAPYGIIEVARTGRVAMTRDSGFDSRYLEKTYMTLGSGTW